ncbi:hypothetical protein [Agromyces sp. Leaf222]|uniref:hypothetical protein n=1 Tax=Agromyces sp. Leaf222 TaxID=1735688 RepID=UPI0006F6CBA4|nr:hypothetical protein [Agromyces sp. Leaf222]KQM81276.1 hypothetical protein ASE68_15930 [Agromyces sp. Leaf222]
MDTASAVTELARGLFDPARDRPWVVVTSAFGAREPELNVADLVAEVGDVSRVFAIETGDLTRELSRLLPDRLDVYGGAGRSYPVGFDAATSTSESRLRFPMPSPPIAGVSARIYWHPTTLKFYLHGMTHDQDAVRPVGPGEG